MIGNLSKELTEVVHSHPIVHRVLYGGGSMEDCVIALAKHNEELMKRIFHLHASVPPNWRSIFEVEEDEVDEDAHLPS